MTNTYDCFVNLDDTNAADRRREPRTAPAGEARVVVGLPWGGENGLLWDVSRSGAKIYFPRGDYARDEEQLSEVLESRARIRVLVRGERDTREARIVWHGLAENGGYVLGIELARDATRFETGEEPAPRAGLLQSFSGRRAA